MKLVIGKPREIMPETAVTLPARYYTDTEFFRRELDGLFGTMWFCAGRSEEVEEPGQYVLREINRHNIIVTRTNAGIVKAFHNVCRHRGTRICTDAPGRF